MKNKGLMKILSALLIVVLVVSMFSVAGLNTVAVESVTEVPEGYVGIYTKEDLDNVKLDMSGKYIMMNSIIFDDTDYEKGGDFYNGGCGWSPIGTTSAPFKGTFDGNGYSIYNLKITNPTADYQGLFGYISNSATVQNVNLKQADITGDDYVGGICGYAFSNYSSVQGEHFAHIVGCYVSGAVSGNNYIGGICGAAYSSYGYTISSSNRYYYYGDSDITECHNIADVTGKKFVGGIVGNIVNRYSDVHRCVNIGSVEASGSYAGGICGYVDSSSNYYNNKCIDLIKYCFNDGIVKANYYAGGILGGSNVSGYDDYESTHQVKLQYCYSIGTIAIKSSNLGGLVGSPTYIQESPTCYYLDESVSSPTNTIGNAKSIDQMKKQTTYENWDFSTIWTMAGDEEYKYPELINSPIRTPLDGVVKIIGGNKKGTTLVADVSGLSTEAENVTLIWRADGKVIGTGEEYTIGENDDNVKITLTAYGEGLYDGIVTSDVLTVECTHNFSTEWTVDKETTCAEEGSKSHHCEICDEKTDVTAIEKLPHSFTTHVYDNNETCTADGTKTAKCDNCDATDTVIVSGSILDHSFTNYINDGNETCLENGTKTAKCDTCDLTDTVVIEDSALGHDYVADVTEPTCTTKGYTTYTCSRCGDEYMGDYVNEVHNYGEWMVDVEATCVDAGSKHRDCTLCSEEVAGHRETATIEATGHSYGKWIVDSVPTCTEDGLKHKVCQNCTDVTEGNTITEAIDAEGHTYTSVVTDPTCTSSGYTTHTCVKGDHEYISDIVDANGHKYIEKVTRATRTEYGFTTYTCMNCTSSYVDDFVEPLGYTVEGSVTVFGVSSNEITIELIDVYKSEVVQIKTMAGNSGEISFEKLEAGEYALRISKANHVTREYDVTIDDEDIELDIQLNLLGDINGDGKVNTLDVARANANAKGVTTLAGYDFECADINGDGKVNTLDVARINAHAKGVTTLW